MSEKLFEQLLKIIKAVRCLIEIKSERNPDRQDWITKAFCWITIAGIVLMAATVAYLFLYSFGVFPSASLRKQTTFLAALIFVGGFIIVVVATVSLSGAFQSMEDGEQKSIAALTKPVVSNQFAEIIKRGFEETHGSGERSTGGDASGTRELSLASACLEATFHVESN